MSTRNALYAVLFAAAVINIESNPASAVEITDVYVADFKTTQTVSNIPIGFDGKIYIGVDVGLVRTPVILIRAVANLSDLQRKIPALVSTVKLPRDNCGSFSANNPVVSLSNPRLSFAGGGNASFHVDGEVDVWDCRENPIPNSKLEFDMVKIGPLKTKLTPRVVTWPGSPIKNKLGTQPFSVDAPFGLKTINKTAVELVPGEARLNLSGQYVGITKAILDVFKVDVQKKLNDLSGMRLIPKR